jgi:hypothetical protein
MNESRFTGSAWALAGWYFLLLLSAYLITPIAWVIPKYAKWYYSNTTILEKNYVSIMKVHGGDN